MATLVYLYVRLFYFLGWWFLLSTLTLYALTDVIPTEACRIAPPILAVIAAALTPKPAEKARRHPLLRKK